MQFSFYHFFYYFHVFRFSSYVFVKKYANYVRCIFLGDRTFILCFQSPLCNINFFGLEFSFFLLKNVEKFTLLSKKIHCFFWNFKIFVWFVRFCKIFPIWTKIIKYYEKLQLWPKNQFWQNLDRNWPKLIFKCIQYFR